MDQRRYCKWSAGVLRFPFREYPTTVHLSDRSNAKHHGITEDWFRARVDGSLCALTFDARRVIAHAWFRRKCTVREHSPRDIITEAAYKIILLVYEDESAMTYIRVPRINWIVHSAIIKTETKEREFFFLYSFEIRVWILSCYVTGKNNARTRAYLMRWKVKSIKEWN